MPGIRIHRFGTDEAYLLPLTETDIGSANRMLGEPKLDEAIK
jgi:hypothetical protein